MGSRLSGFQLGSEPLGLVEGVRFDLGLDYLEGTGKDIPGGRSAGAKAEDENVPPLLRVIRPGGVSGRASVRRKACILQGSHFLLHFSPSPPPPPDYFQQERMWGRQKDQEWYSETSKEPGRNAAAEPFLQLYSLVLTVCEGLKHTLEVRFKKIAGSRSLTQGCKLKCLQGPGSQGA